MVLQRAKNVSTFSIMTNEGQYNKSNILLVIIFCIVDCDGFAFYFKNFVLLHDGIHDFVGVRNGGQFHKSEAT